MNEEFVSIGSNYEKFYRQRSRGRVYPTEFVVRTFLAQYPELLFEKPAPGDSVLEVGFGDGRNTQFLCERSLDVYGVELTEKMCTDVTTRLSQMNFEATLRVGRNSALPFPDSMFRYLLAVHSCYYVDPGETFLLNLAEYSRVLDKGGWLVASVPSTKCYIFDGAEKLDDGSFVIKNDPYGNRNGYRLHGFSTKLHVQQAFGAHFTCFSIGVADNDFFGIHEHAFWVVCRNNK